MRVSLVQTTSDSLKVDGVVAFILASWMLHEVPDKLRFFTETRDHLAPDGAVLVAESRSTSAPQLSRPASRPPGGWAS